MSSTWTPVTAQVQVSHETHVVHQASTVVHHTTTTQVQSSVQVDLRNFIGKAFMFRSFNVPGVFVHARKDGVWLDKFNGTPEFLKDSSYVIVAGLAGKGVSFRSAIDANKYLRHRGGKLYLDANDGKALFKADATFNVHYGLGAGNGGRFGISFESVNVAGSFIRHAGVRLQISKMTNSAVFKMDSTWEPVTAQVQVSHQTQTVSCGFSCQVGKEQKVKFMAHAKVANRPECAKKCCMTKGCAGFDFNVATKDCWLSGTPWTQVAPVPGAGGRPIPNRLTCMRGQAGDEPESLLVADVASEGDFPKDDELVMEDNEEEIIPEEGVLVEEDEAPETLESDEKMGEEAEDQDQPEDEEE